MTFDIALPNGLNRRDELLDSISFLFYFEHFRLSLLNNFYYDILHLYNIVIPIINSVTSENRKKAGMACRNTVKKKQSTLL